ncbi:endonuclease I family protein [Cytobacillus sp. FJAT-54145]|uniref:Endonuclease I family protein n=1 Tax=Cytobacillus spartinae TaxID=3299023 RepID=A0ABW6KC32_9BACI
MKRVKGTGKFKISKKMNAYKNLQKPLIILKKNRMKIEENLNIYYDEQIDQRDIKHYYQTRSNLNYSFNKLHELVKRTHKNQLPYFLSKDMYLYTWVDLQPNGTVKSIYSGMVEDPQTLIREDFNTIKQRHEMFQTALMSTMSKAEINLKLKRIEWELKMNTEHIVPQSWFGGREPMKGDLHHLFACQRDCNTSRSNFPYTDFSFYVPESPNERIQNQCGLAMEGLFEPEYGKGVVARAMLYFLLRYPKAIKKSTLKRMNLSVLLRWNQEFEVSLYERHRNQAIYRIQGNRNPFIDFPELVEKIEFPIG